MVKLLPKEFTKGLEKVVGDFLKEVWRGMGPGPSRRVVKKQPKPRSMRRVK